MDPHRPNLRLINTPASTREPAVLSDHAYVGLLGELCREAERLGICAASSLLVNLLVLVSAAADRTIEVRRRSFNLTTLQSSQHRTRLRLGLNAICVGERPSDQDRAFARAMTLAKAASIDPDLILVRRPRNAVFHQLDTAATTTRSVLLRVTALPAFLRQPDSDWDLLATALEGHATMIGHATVETMMPVLDAFRGYDVVRDGIWAWVPPTGNDRPPELALVLTRTAMRLSESIHFASRARILRTTDEAAALIDNGWPLILATRNAHIDATVAFEVVLRLASLLALLDCSTTIREGHVRAAFSIWQFSNETKWHLLWRDTTPFEWWHHRNHHRNH